MDDQHPVIQLLLSLVYRQGAVRRVEKVQVSQIYRQPLALEQQQLLEQLCAERYVGLLIFALGKYKKVYTPKEINELVNSFLLEFVAYQKSYNGIDGISMELLRQQFQRFVEWK
ncbi:MAG: hypothetical protein AAF798_17360 [Bacteroidota bacterium]